MSVLMLSAAARTALLCYAALAGMCAGSFVCCAAWRMVNGERLSRGRSKCPACGHALGVRDLIPLGSYILCRGRCRYCGERIPPRYPICEAALAVAFVLSVLRFGVSFEALRAVLFASVMLCLSLADLDTQTIPDRFHVIGIALWAVTLPFIAAERGTAAELPSLIGKSLLGGVCIALPLLILSLVMDKLLGRESMGGGDIKLFFVTGLFLGPLNALIGLIFACIIGIVFALVTRRRREAFPFGPSAALAAFITLLYGGAIADAYLSLFIY